MVWRKITANSVDCKQIILGLQAMEFWGFEYLLFGLFRWGSYAEFLKINIVKIIFLHKFTLQFEQRIPDIVNNKGTVSLFSKLI